MTEKAMNFIAKNKTRPFFLYLPYTLPHLSLQVPEEYVNKYKGQFNETPYYGQNGYAACKYPLSTYAAMITYLDDQVGLIMEKIKSLDLIRTPSSCSAVIMALHLPEGRCEILQQQYGIARPENGII